MAKPPTTTIGLRIPVELRNRIQAAAEQRGQSLTAYVLSWLPVVYDDSAETNGNKAQQRQRVSRSQHQSSPARDN